MNQPITQETERVAESVLICNACEWLKRKLNAKLKSDLDPIELQHVELARKSGFKILPGVPYIEESGVYNNKPYKSNYLKPIHEICLKYGLYSYAKK